MQGKLNTIVETPSDAQNHDPDAKIVTLKARNYGSGGKNYDPEAIIMVPEIIIAEKSGQKKRKDERNGRRPRKKELPGQESCEG